MRIIQKALCSLKTKQNSVGERKTRTDIDKYKDNNYYLLNVKIYV